MNRVDLVGAPPPRRGPRRTATASHRPEAVGRSDGRRARVRPAMRARRSRPLPRARARAARRSGSRSSRSAGGGALGRSGKAALSTARAARVARRAPHAAGPTEGRIRDVGARSRASSPPAPRAPAGHRRAQLSEWPLRSTAPRRLLGRARRRPRGRGRGRRVAAPATRPRPRAPSGRHPGRSRARCHFARPWPEPDVGDQRVAQRAARAEPPHRGRGRGRRARPPAAWRQELRRERDEARDVVLAHGAGS